MINKLSNNSYLYKYLPAEYCEDFLYKGKIHFRKAAYFINLENDSARGDKYDGAKITNSPLIIKDSIGERKTTTKTYTVRSQDELKYSYIFCTSKSLSSNLFSEFKTNYCVKIKDVNEFKKRIVSNSNYVYITRRLTPLNQNQETREIKIQFSYSTRLISDDIVYFDDSKIENTVKIIPNIRQKFFHKRKSLYEWENEYRFLIQPKSEIEISFIQEEDLKILKDFQKQYSLYDLLPVGINITIGNIEDIAEITTNNNRIT